MKQEQEVSDIVVVMEEDTPAEIDDLVKKLKELGVSVSDVDNDNGVVEGTVDAGKLKQIEKIPGVKYVRNVFTYVSELPVAGAAPGAEDEDSEEDVGR
jgi:hypothetical protein